MMAVSISLLRFQQHMIVIQSKLGVRSHRVMILLLRVRLGSSTV